PSRFTALFRAHTGTSPMGYVRKVRVDHARRLLADVDLSIKEVAARVGFDDAFHFSKVFRAVDGLAPTRYREALLAGRG
ncbi:MAG TPA: helix-turn-helix transcriptional regulator, partial [Tepidisphaeraceae bacterium]|nr:helix-turn-helix transcriptional regulator [Tepidisphaeraceae bacterium]